MLDIHSYAYKGYTIVSLPGGCLIHEGDTGADNPVPTGNMVHQTTSVDAAQKWIDKTMACSEVC